MFTTQTTNKGLCLPDRESKNNKHENKDYDTHDGIQQFLIHQKTRHYKKKEEMVKPYYSLQRQVAPDNSHAAIKSNVHR